MVEKYFSQFLPKRPTQTIFDLGPKERFNMIREVHHVHQKSWKKHSKKISKRSHQKRSTCSLAPSSRHYLPEYTKQEISQSVYNIIVPCIIFSCYLIPKIIQEMLRFEPSGPSFRISSLVNLSPTRNLNEAFQRNMLSPCLWLQKNSKLTKMLSITKFYKKEKIFPALLKNIKLNKLVMKNYTIVYRPYYSPKVKFQPSKHKTCGQITSCEWLKLMSDPINWIARSISPSLIVL